MMNAPNTPGKQVFKIFLSHSHTDSALARKIRSLIVHRLGLPVFMDEDLRAGESWRSKLRKELEQAEMFIALLTPQSASNPMLLAETGAAWSMDKPILALVTRQSVLERFPAQLRNFQVLDAQDLETPAGLEKFASALERSLAESFPA